MVPKWKRKNVLKDEWSQNGSAKNVLKNERSQNGSAKNVLNNERSQNGSAKNDHSPSMSFRTFYGI